MKGCKLLIKLLTRAGILVYFKQLKFWPLTGTPLLYITRKKHERCNREQHRASFADRPMLATGRQTDIPKAQKTIVRADISEKPLAIAVFLFTEVTAAEKVFNQFFAGTTICIEAPRGTVSRQRKIGNAGQCNDFSETK